MARTIKQIAKLLFLLLAPLLLALMWLAFVCSDLLTRRRGPRSPSPDFQRARRKPVNASIVIPSWNARDLLERYLPSVIAAVSPGDEIIVVDNASTDGSAELVRRRFPRVRVIQAERNLGFGGGSNLGIREARHPVAVLLNNDMRVNPDFLRPLLEGFTDDGVFAVSAQIFFSDPARRREETGLTAGAFERGFIRVRHVVDDRVDRLYPTFYAGGGSTAYDRDKFLELGGFDSLFEPFYLEDTDVSYRAWRRGWKVLYQPRSGVFHEHRATIGKRFSREAILAYLQKNYLLMVWKNVHRRRWLAAHLCYLYSHMALCWIGRPTETRTSIGAFLLALKQLPQAFGRRREALSRAAVGDQAAFERTRPSVFRDLFVLGGRQACEEAPGAREARGAEKIAAPATPPASAAGPAVSARPLNILFVSPYSIYPPIHGGAVFMLEAMRELAKRNNVFVLSFVDRPEELESARGLEQFVRKADVYLRLPKPRRYFGTRSHAEETFRDPRFAELLDQAVFRYDIDVIQYEYTQLAQYRLPLRHTPQCLFEHDVYFRSVGRHLLSGEGGVIVKAQEAVEWLRAIYFEIPAVQRFDAVFTCHENERRLLESFRRNGRPPILSGLRAVIDVHSHPYPGGPRVPDSLLFVGNFQHRPNVDGLHYFCREILPLIRARRPRAMLHVVGAHATAEIKREVEGMAGRAAVHFLGQVPDIRAPLAECAVFLCPIRTGAGMRVKILEAFASGIPVVSTPLGAEGLNAADGTDLLLGRSPREFADAALKLLENPEQARAMAASARSLVERCYDWPAAGLKLEALYRELILKKQSAARSGAERTD